MKLVEVEVSAAVTAVKESFVNDLQTLYDVGVPTFVHVNVALVAVAAVCLKFVGVGKTVPVVFLEIFTGYEVTALLPVPWIATIWKQYVVKAAKSVNVYVIAADAGDDTNGVWGADGGHIGYGDSHVIWTANTTDDGNGQPIFLDKALGTATASWKKAVSAGAVTELKSK